MQNETIKKILLKIAEINIKLNFLEKLQKEKLEKLQKEIEMLDEARRLTQERN